LKAIRHLEETIDRCFDDFMKWARQRPVLALTGLAEAVPQGGNAFETPSVHAVPEDRK